MSRAPLVVVGDALLDRDLEGRAGRLSAKLVRRLQLKVRPGDLGTGHEVDVITGVPK